MSKSQSAILFIINEEYGQANVCLSVIYELLLQGTFPIHVASWLSLKKRLDIVRGTATKENSTLLKGTNKITFHPLPGLGMVKSIYRIFKDMRLILGGSRSQEEYLVLFEAMRDLIVDVQPRLVVVDPFMAMGIDACRFLGSQYVVLSPNSLKDAVLLQQPWAKALWKYPAMGTGYSFPLPWHLIPVNIIIVVLLIMSMVTSSEFRGLDAARKKRGIRGTYPMLEPYSKNVEYIFSCCEEIDFPLQIPTNVHACGPILLPVIPVSETDPKLASWLGQRPTVLIHFGSHFVADVEFARQMAGAIRMLLDKDPLTQILWKLKKHGVYDSAFSDSIKEEIARDQVRIVDWLDADPLAILSTGNISCVVHHGGATSYNEAIFTGVPQIICPLWLDCLDYAAKIEWLGVGIDGNRQVGFPIEAKELGNAMIEVFASPRSSAFRDRASAVSRTVRKYGGRTQAAKKITELYQMS